jgi:hypothetical protein
LLDTPLSAKRADKSVKKKSWMGIDFWAFSHLTAFLIVQPVPFE